MKTRTAWTFEKHYSMVWVTRREIGVRRFVVNRPICYYLIFFFLDYNIKKWQVIVIYVNCIFIPAFLEQKGGLRVTVRRPSVHPSGRPSVRQQFTSIFSNTIDARITKPIWIISLCIQMLATYYKIFSVFQFWNN